MRDNEELMNGLRSELRRVVAQRFKRVDIERFKTELKEHVTFFVYEHTQRSPIIIPVVNVVGGRPEGGGNRGPRPQNGNNRPADKSPEELADEQQKRFAEMRAKLLGQDARTD